MVKRIIIIAIVAVVVLFNIWIGVKHFWYDEYIKNKKDKETIDYEYWLNRILEKRDGKYGYVDTTGKTVIPFIYEEAKSFNSKDIYRHNDYGKNICQTDVIRGGQYYSLYMDGTEGEPFERFRDTITDNRGIINKSGKILIPPIYYDITFLNISKPLFIAIIKINVISEYQYDIKYGLIDTNNKVIIPFEYDNFDPSTKEWGLFYVAKYLKKDTDGNHNSYSLDRKFYNEDYATDVFGNEWGAVNEVGKWGVVNDKGEIILNCEYDDVSNFSLYRNSDSKHGDLLARVAKNGKKGVVNHKGKFVMPCEFSAIKVCNYPDQPLCFKVKTGNKEYYLDRNGNEVKPPQKN